MEKVFFNGWEEILRTLIIGIAGYAGIIIILRISGKRTLSKLNAFDFIITIALGSLFASAILNKSVSLTEFIVSFFMLVFLQYIITWLSIRYSGFQKIIKSEPTLIFYNGKFLQSCLRKERITPEEVMAMVREKGFANLSQIRAIVLETGGEISIVTNSEPGYPESLKTVAKK